MQFHSISSYKSCSLRMHVQVHCQCIAHSYFIRYVVVACRGLTSVRLEGRPLLTSCKDPLTTTVPHTRTLTRQDKLKLAASLATSSDLQGILVEIFD